VNGLRILIIDFVMDYELDKFRNIDGEVFLIIKEPLAKAHHSFAKKSIPNTGRALLSFIARMDFIKLAIFDLMESTNGDCIYVLKILFRSFIDHFLKFLYVFFRYVTEKNDEPGIDYYHYCDLMEVFSYGQALKVSYNLFLDQHTKENVFELLRKKHPYLKGLSKKDIEFKASQFLYRSIVKYLKNLRSAPFNKEYYFLFKIIPNYSFLSSFVHGGPMADKENIKYIDANKRREESMNVLSNVVFLSVATKELFFVILTHTDSQYQVAYEKVHKIRSKTPSFSSG